MYPLMNFWLKNFDWAEHSIRIVSSIPLADFIWAEYLDYDLSIL